MDTIRMNQENFRQKLKEYYDDEKFRKALDVVAKLEYDPSDDEDTRDTKSCETLLQECEDNDLPVSIWCKNGCVLIAETAKPNNNEAVEFCRRIGLVDKKGVE